MRTKRTLALRRETLIQLTDDDMNAVVGGSHGCPTLEGCETLTHGPSIDETCPTTPAADCVRTLRTINPLSCAVC